MSSFNNYGISVDKICNSALPTPLPPLPLRQPLKY